MFQQVHSRAVQTAIRVGKVFKCIKALSFFIPSTLDVDISLTQNTSDLIMFDITDLFMPYTGCLSAHHLLATVSQPCYVWCWKHGIIFDIS